MKTLTGKVIAKKFENTAVVEVEKTKVHPLYGKTIKYKKNFSVHDEVGVKEGERVEFAQSRPFSKTKKWKIVGRIK